MPQVVHVRKRRRKEHVMGIIEIRDLDGRDLYPYRMTDPQLRSRQRPDEALFIAEGPKVVRAALEAGCRPVSMLIRRKLITGPGAALIDMAGEIPVYTADDDVLGALTGFRLQRAWVLCAMRRPPERRAEELLDTVRRVAVLENISEPSNVGAIFRSAAALGVGAVLLSPACCDPLHRRSVRVCMGTVFRIPWARTGEDSGLTLLKEHGFCTAGLALRDDALPLDDPCLAAEPRLALLLGTEDTGLAAETIRDCDRIVRIPMAPGVDSLNVAAAAAVAFWQLRPQNGAAGG